MLNVKLVEFLEVNIGVVAHVGNLETIMRIAISELSQERQDALMAMLQAHVEEMPTQILINSLSN